MIQNGTQMVADLLEFSRVAQAADNLDQRVPDLAAVGFIQAAQGVPLGVFAFALNRRRQELLQIVPRLVVSFQKD